MTQAGDTKLRRLEARHPGLIARVEAMFDAFKPIVAVAEMVRTECGEPIGNSAIAKHRRWVWRVRRDRERKVRAKQAAWEQLMREGRS